MKYLYMVVVSTVLFGCSAAHKQAVPAATPMKHSAFLGKKLGIFILSNGPLYQKKSLSGGTAVYRWNSHSQMISLRRDGERDLDPMNTECEIRIYVKADGRIQSIFALDDASQNWDPDACADYLK